MKTQARWIARIAIVSSAVLVAVTVGLPAVHGQAAHVRWDIINLTPGPTVNPGGQASAMNNIGETITFTGTETFVDPSGRGGTSSAVTGGGNWTITTASGSSSGTYEVRGLVRFEEAPGVFPGAVDNIGSPADFRSGLAVLRIEYNDGSHGILVVPRSRHAGYGLRGNHSVERFRRLLEPRGTLGYARWPERQPHLDPPRAIRPGPSLAERR